MLALAVSIGFATVENCLYLVTPARWQVIAATRALTIAPAPLQIGNTSLPNGEVGKAYAVTLNAAGGTPPYGNYGMTLRQIAAQCSGHGAGNAALGVDAMAAALILREYLDRERSGGRETSA